MRKIMQRKMSILFVHNYYQQPGGEDAGVRQERDLLAAAGHRIIEYVRHSDEIVLGGFWGRMHLCIGTVWSKRTLHELSSLLRREKPDIAHFHNIVPLISPSAYYACARATVPVVQTLHNFRLLCPAGSLYRQGRVCEECMEHTLLPSLRHRCYKNSLTATGTVALMVASNRLLGTWDAKVDCFIARTEFAKRKFVQGGLPADKIVVKPCFVDPDPGPSNNLGDAALFVGRLSVEKGVRTLLEAWEHLEGRIPLRIAGDGPLRAEVEERVVSHNIPSITFLGRLESAAVITEMKHARFLLFPSEWYEGLPLTIVEAFACGIPVFSSRIGSMIEVVEHGRCGLHFTPGDPKDLAASAKWAWEHPREVQTMGRNARAEYEARYTGERNLQMLTEIHEQVLARRGLRESASHAIA